MAVMGAMPIGVKVPLAIRCSRLATYQSMVAVPASSALNGSSKLASPADGLSLAQPAGGSSWGAISARIWARVGVVGETVMRGVGGVIGVVMGGTVGRQGVGGCASGAFGKRLCSEGP